MDTTALRQGQPAPPRIVTLMAVASVGALATNIFLPSLPSMARDFGTDYSVIQLLVSLFLVATAVLQPVIGPLSDRYGRRPVLLTALTIFVVSTLAAIYAPTVEVLMACRLFQAASAAGIVLSRAIVRDTVTSMDDAARGISYVTMGMSIMPMIGPFIGGYLDEFYGWKSTFLLMLAFGLFALTLAYFDLPETNHSRSGGMAAQMKAYPDLVGSGHFWGYALAVGFSSGAYFAFLGGGPFVATEILHMGPSDYGIYFALVSLGYILGNFLSARGSRRLGAHRMMVLGSIVGVAGGMAIILVFLAGLFGPMTLFTSVMVIGVGNGMTLPSANAGMISVRADLAGSAAGLGGMVQLGLGAALAFVAGAVLGAETGPLPLLLIMLASMAASLVASLYVSALANTATARPRPRNGVL